VEHCQRVSTSIYNFNTEFTDFAKKATSEYDHRGLPQGAYSQPGGILQWIIRRKCSSRLQIFNTEFVKRDRSSELQPVNKRDRSSELPSVNTEFFAKYTSSTSIIEDYHRGAYSQPGGIPQWIIGRECSSRLQIFNTEFVKRNSSSELQQLLKRDRSSELQIVNTEFSQNIHHHRASSRITTGGLLANLGVLNSGLTSCGKSKKILKCSCNDTGDLKKSLYC